MATREDVTTLDRMCEVLLTPSVTVAISATAAAVIPSDAFPDLACDMRPFANGRQAVLTAPVRTMWEVLGMLCAYSGGRCDSGRWDAKTATAVRKTIRPVRDAIRTAVRESMSKAGAQ